MKRNSVSSNPVFLILIMVITAFAGYQLRPLLSQTSPEPRTISPRGALADDERTTIAIFNQASPSVVYITTTSRLLNPWTRRVYESKKGTGSGFIWDKLGHIVTNYHVIEGADSAHIRLSDGRVYEASLIGVSQEHDLAILKINVAFNAPPPVPLGSSSNLLVGQKVFAIGNPFGLDYTLTSGIISALNRTIHEGGRREIRHLIQTDAAINPGNSGGPLLDSAGRLIGINTAIYSPSGAYAGIGFAIPVNTVNRLVPKLIKHGSIVTPWLGIVIDDRIGGPILREMGAEGVLVLRVEPGSPAARVGLRPTRMEWNGSIIAGDIIRSIDNQPIRSSEDLLQLLAEHEAGERIELSVLRRGKTIAIPVTLSLTPYRRY